MAIQFVAGQVAVGDPSPIGPTALSGPAKDVQVKIVKLSSANFATVAVNTKVAVLPAEVTIIGIQTWVKTALSGNSVASPTLSLGTASAGTEFTSALAITNTTGTFAVATPITGIVQNYAVPLGTDVQVWASGSCSTGNPTAGEIYVIIQYVR